MERTKEKNIMLNLDEIDQVDGAGKNEQEKYASIHISRKLKMRIYKPLVSIKAGYFLWMTASSSIVAYFYVFLKLQGLTLHELFWINMILSVTQIIEIPLLAAIVDKLGLSPKLTLISNILLSGLVLFGISVMPPLPYCEAGTHYNCFNDSISFTKPGSSCETDFQRSLCEVQCMESLGDMCGSKSNCETIHDFFKNSTRRNDTNEIFPTEPMLSFSNISRTLCEGVWNDSCFVSCPMVDCCKRQKILLIVLYGFFTCVFMVTFTNVFRFLDVTTVALFKEHDFDYGVVRFWGILGQLIGPSISGLVVHLLTPEGQPSNYKAIFYFEMILVLLTALVSFKIDVRPLSQGTDMLKKVSTLMRMPDVLIFMFILLSLGTTWAFNFLYKTWYLSDIGADAQVLSVVKSLMALYGLPFLYVAEWVLNKVGNTRMIALALLMHAVHSFGYSLIYNSWYAVIFEATSIFTYHLLWVTVIRVTRKMTPEGLLATVNTSAGAIHFNWGRIIGSFFGGFLMKTYGGRHTYYIFGIINTALAVLYTIYLCIKKKQKNHTI